VIKRANLASALTLGLLFLIGMAFAQADPGVSNNSGSFDGPAELPRLYVQSSLINTPAPGKTISVTAGGSLKAALASANCGDTIELQAGAEFQGNINLPAKPCDDQHWIVIRTSALLHRLW